MDDKTRIEKDILMFEDNISKMSEELKNHNNKVVELAKQYYEDSKYYLKKKDYLTAFGCINYAHGLLDALIKF